MKTLTFINLKGGTGKTVSAANVAHILAAVHHKRVLLVDADKQGNASRYFRLYGEQDGTAALLRGGGGGCVADNGAVGGGHCGSYLSHAV